LSTEKKIFLSLSLKNFRKYKEISLDGLAKQLNINFETIKNYEWENNFPPIDTLIKLSDFFEVSVDFLLLWNTTFYPHNIKFLSLAKKIDSMDQVNRFQIENTANALLKSKQDIDKNGLKKDDIDVDLTDSINQNIRIVREKKGLSQRALAKTLEVNQSLIAHYENKTSPSIEKLLKLSNFFNVSVHAIVTGKKLDFSFHNKNLGEVMLLADQLATLEEIKMLVYLMETIIKNSQS
jgi:transcriptional regulator with XRE-family HTH domain